ncbi:MAG: tRNA uridine-5-carboxymethylaminomethyl(34) synthesis GTPase MnmE [Alistipes sp.]|nr:tRNA uridine-5-carboxymethylaminomethyl(34) synthesis GTPase MnmE [Alistipes sp.]
MGGAIAVVRMSGEGSVACCDKIFKGRKPLTTASTHTLHYGTIVDGERVVDDVVVALYLGTQSYTGEESVEISCHGSRYIVAEIVRLLCAEGARMAHAGEFSQRAILAGRIDLSQAEAVADLIAAESRAEHAIASTQMRGGYSALLDSLRDELLEICALLELELDFGEEDVEFADRTRLSAMLDKVESAVCRLLGSFRMGNAIREGVKVAIIGRPNVGKSTLLNALLQDNRAMVSDIAGTTRDTIEEVVMIDDIRFRFIDTAGLHETDDQLEKMGIERTERAIKEADIIIYMVEPSQTQVELPELTEQQRALVVVNKMDTATEEIGIEGAICISARYDDGTDKLRSALCELVNLDGIYKGDVVVSNMRHASALNDTLTHIHQAKSAIRNDISSELLAEDIRHAADALGEITGRITNDHILQTIFSTFCIGK